MTLVYTCLRVVMLWAIGLGALGCVAQDVAVRVPTELDMLLVGVREGAWGDFRGHLSSYVGNVPTEFRMAAQPVMKTALERIDSWKAWWWMKMEFDNMMMKKRVTGAELVRQSEERSRFQGKTSWQREGSAVLWRVLAGLAVCGVVAVVGYRSLKFEV